MQDLPDHEMVLLVNKFNAIFFRTKRNLKAKIISSNLLSIENPETVIVYEARTDDNKIYLNRIERPLLQ